MNTVDYSHFSGATFDPNAKVVFVLVHGTFAKSATWVASNSDFARRLQAEIPNAHIETFRWTGRNSEGSRCHAASELARFTSALRAKHSDSQIVVIGHSHGGNVAIGAYNSDGGPESIDKVVCLGTPFFRFRARELKPAANVIAAGLIAIFCLVMLVNRTSMIFSSVMAPTMKMYMDSGLDPNDPSELRQKDMLPLMSAMLKTSYALIAFAVIPPLAFVLVPPLAWLLTRYLGYLQSSWLRRYGQTNVTPPTLVLYTRGDEARGWLWFVERFWRPVFQSMFLFGQVLTKALILAVPLGFLALARSILQRGGDEYLPVLGSIGSVVVLTTFIYVSTLAAFVLSIFATVYGSLVAGTPWGFGSAGLISYQLIAVNVMEWPDEDSNIDAVSVSFAARRSFRELLHSTFYSSDLVVKHIGSWLGGERFSPGVRNSVFDQKVPIAPSKKKQWMYAALTLLIFWFLLWGLEEFIFNVLL
jgi:pimeloyl-ACP methyl ester carboxylesterase